MSSNSHWPAPSADGTALSAPLPAGTVVDASSVPLPVHSPTAWVCLSPFDPSSHTPSAVTRKGVITSTAQPRVKDIALVSSRPLVVMSTPSVAAAADRGAANRANATSSTAPPTPRMWSPSHPDRQDTTRPRMQGARHALSKRRNAQYLHTCE